MVEFKDIANDAWKGMQDIRRSSAPVMDFGSLFGRVKRQYGEETAEVEKKVESSGGGQCSKI